MLVSRNGSFCCRPHSPFPFSVFMGLVEAPERGRALIAAQVVGVVVIKKIYIPVDTLCCSRHIYLRLSARASLKVYRGPRKSVDFWGEEKWRQAKLAREFHLASPFRRRSGCNLLRSTQYVIGRAVIRFIKIS